MQGRWLNSPLCFPVAVGEPLPNDTGALRLGMTEDVWNIVCVFVLSAGISSLFSYINVFSICMSLSYLRIPGAFIVLSFSANNLSFNVYHIVA